MIKKLFLILFIFSYLYPVKAQDMPPSPVVVEEVTEKVINTPLRYVGEVEPVRRTLVASEIGGLVIYYSAKEGNYVKKGTLLAKLNTKSLDLSLAEARAAKNEAEARFNLADANYKRFEELYNKGIASLQELQDVQSEREAQLARTILLNTRIESQLYDISRSEIRAPYTGYITTERSQVGEWISEGGAVAEIIDISSVKIKADIPERYISKIKVGDKVDIVVDSLPGLTIDGEVTSIIPQADMEARTFPVEVKVNNRVLNLKSGMVARISFSIGESASIKLVPKDAIVNSNNSNILFVVSDGMVNPVPVTTGRAVEGLIEVTGPVEKGQAVVIRGNERLRPNQPVTIVDRNGDAVETK